MKSSWTSHIPTVARIEATVSHHDALEAARGYARWIESIGLIASIEDSSRDDWDYDTKRDVTIQTVAVTVVFRNWYFAENTKLGEAAKQLGLRWKSDGSIQAPLTGTILIGQNDDIETIFMVAECNHKSDAQHAKIGLEQLGWLVNKIVY